MIDVAGVGASSVDLVYILPAYPAPEGPLAKLRVTQHAVSFGGQMATAMAGCASLGLRAAFIGSTGSDAHGAALRRELQGRGVDLSHARVIDGPNPHAVILLTEGSPERIVLWSRDPQADMPPMSLPREPIASARLLHVDDVDIEAAIAAATIARAHGRFITTDIDRVTDRTEALLALATHPILAEHVPAALTGEDGLERALRKLRRLNPGPLTVTLGPRGAVALEGDRLIEAPGFEVEAVDTTGAGDVFRAGFIAALLDGRPLAGILRFANAAAALSCTKQGAMNSVPDLRAVTALLSSSQTANRSW